ncbi:MAG TPA: SRPBCC family protein [Thermoanaerobaculia bacterium]
MHFRFTSHIPCTPERLFAFHELPDALRRLTPPWEKSRVVQHAPSLRPGSRTIVKVRVAPLIWIRTESLHTIYEPPLLFVDEMVRGPFARWIHRHEIAAEGDGARLTDSIEVEAPFGIIGRLVAPWLILPRLRRLFAYRHEVTRRWCVGE